MWISCLIAVVSTFSISVSAQQVPYPHVSQCNFCKVCHLHTPDTGPSAGRRQVLQQITQKLRQHAIQHSSSDGLQPQDLELEVELPQLLDIRGASQQRTSSQPAGAGQTQQLRAAAAAAAAASSHHITSADTSRERQQALLEPLPLHSLTRGSAGAAVQLDPLLHSGGGGSRSSSSSSSSRSTNTGGASGGSAWASGLSALGRALSQAARPPPGQRDWDFNTTIAPMRAQIRAKARKQNCTECYGCSADVQVLKGSTAFGRNFSVEQGASNEWLFTTTAAGRRAIVKVWCVPIDKMRKTFRWACANTREAARATNFLLAQQRVMEECGLLDVTIRLWMAPVNAVIPGYGFHIWWDGLWMDQAPGLSLNQVAYLTKTQMRRGNLLDILQTKVNKTQVVYAALYDLLTSQCDRHSQNVFLSETGTMTLIDNLQALKYNWLKCSADSIFLPGTGKNEMVRFGGDLVSKRKGARPRKSLNPVLLLDYRCYVEGGKIGTAYPPKLSRCLDTMRGMTAEEVQQRYRFPDLRSAELLHARATDMATLGFEHTLKYGLPLNPSPKRYRWHPPCCEMHINPRGALECSHEWSAVSEFPVGDPLGGGPWTKPYPDPGTYDGATV